MRRTVLLLVIAGLLLTAGCARTIIMLDRADYHYRNGMRFLNQGNVEGARMEFEYAIFLDNGFAPAYVGLALVYGVKGEMEKAVEYMNKGIGIYRQGETKEPDRQAPPPTQPTKED